MEVTPACYAHLTSSLMALAGGRLAVVLEARVSPHYYDINLVLSLFFILMLFSYCLRWLSHARIVTRTFRKWNDP